jgi:hypothetical protein
VERGEGLRVKRFCRRITFLEISDGEWYSVRLLKIKIQSIIVLVLLSIPVTDLVMPGTCAEDLEGLTLALTLPQPPHPPQDKVVVRQIPEPEQSSQPNAPLDDGCFCCCYHVVPQLAFVVPDDITHVELVAVEPCMHLAPEGDPLDHPPRRS